MNCLSFFVSICLLANTFGSLVQKEQLNNKINSRIVGGSDAAEGAYPYQVSLQNHGQHFCGGSILNENWILTAGHCLSGAALSQVTVVVGTNNLTRGGIEHKSKRLIVHPNYNGYELTGDIGLIELDSPLTFSPLVGPISLPKTDIKRPHTPAVATGFGLTSILDSEISADMQFLNVKIVLQGLCRLFSKEKITEKNICTINSFGKGMCKGDSGSPVVVGSEQIGLVSWGIAACALGVPDVHTRVYSYKDWINGYINN